jgi:predicted DNA-binding antitoxin AbrB/MazE fold protein
MRRPAQWLFVLLFCLADAGLSMAQDATVRIRGTIARVEGPAYVVNLRDGSEVKVVVTANATVTAIIAASLQDIKPGSYVGVAGLPRPDGSQKALEVHIFPEAMRGTGEGHRGWDLQPSATMTNGTVEEGTVSVDGQVLKLKYKDGEKVIVVAPDAPIVQYAPADLSELKPGARIFIGAARKRDDGVLETPRINVGRGIDPPM